MPTTIFESGAKLPSARSVMPPVTPSVVSRASVFTRFTGRCSSARPGATLVPCATNRTPPAGTGAVVAVGLGAADAALAAGVTGVGDVGVGAELAGAGAHALNTSVMAIEPARARADIMGDLLTIARA